MMAGFTVAQKLEKGNILGVHLRSIALQPNVTMERYLDFYINKYIPAYEKNYPGVKVYVIKSIRGEDENSFGLAYIFESIDVRNKYWPEKDVQSELALEATKKLQPIIDELRKLGTATVIKLTDWIVL
jgi:hypothetical protein